LHSTEKRAHNNPNSMQRCGKTFERAKQPKSSEKWLLILLIQSMKCFQSLATNCRRLLHVSFVSRAVERKNFLFQIYSEKPFLNVKKEKRKIAKDFFFEKKSRKKEKEF
jgi:hypothetical protein